MPEVSRMSVAPRLASVAERLLGAPPPVRLRAWDGSEAGPPGPPVVVVRHRRALRRLLHRPGELGLARAWVAGEITVGVARHAVVVPVTAIVGVTPERDQLELGLRPAPSEALPDLSGRLGLAFVLRDLCRRRAGVEVRTRAGSITGTIDRVARDHLDLAEHEPGQPRRDRVVRRIRLVPFDAILRVRA